MVGLGLGLGVGLGASESLIADCRYRIRRDQVPVAGYRYTTNIFQHDTTKQTSGTIRKAFLSLSVVSGACSSDRREKN